MVLECVARACARAATDVHREMERGLSGLAAVAATAPFLGFIGTVLGISNSFPGFGTEKSTAMAIIAGRLGDSLVPAAASVLLAIIASCGYRYLRARLDILDIEMETAALDLLNVAQHARFPLDPSVVH
jgi:biopolymer transport protein ExbB/TolQ